MNWKLLIVVVMLFLVVYGVYFVFTQVDFSWVELVPRIFNPLSTSTPYRTAPRTSAPPRVSTPEIRTPEIKTPTPPEGFELGDLSPYYDTVKLSSVRRPDKFGLGGEFTIRVEGAAPSDVDVTGWDIRGNRGSVTIAGAGGVVGPVNHSRIVVRRNTSATFYAAWSSYVKNIELNTCTGYLNATYSVSPKLPTNCPRPPRAELAGFVGECQNFINSLSSCEMPTPSELNQYSVSRDAACRTYIDKLNYDGCVNRYRDLQNFYSYGWRVWMGVELKFDPYHDRLFLYDAAGKLVDEYVY